MHRRRTWWRLSLAAVGVLLGFGSVLVTVLASTAQAHTSLVSSTPADQATLGEEPTRVSLEFDEPIGEPAFIVVTAPDGATVTTGEPDVVDNRVSAVVESTGLAGRYTLAFRVVSTDGHTLSEELTYTVSAGRAVSAVVADSSASSTGFFSQPHGVHLVLAGGGALAALLVLYRPLRRRRE